MKNKEKNTTIMMALIGAVTILSGYSFYKAICPDVQVGIINFGIVQQKAKAYVDAAQQQKKYDEQVQALIMKDKDFIQLQEEGKQLEAQQQTLSKDELERRATALQKRALKINERYRASFERNAMASQLALKALEKQISEAIEATSQKTGVKVLLPINTILYASKKADFTEEFVKELDKRVQNVTYPNPATLQ